MVKRYLWIIYWTFLSTLSFFLSFLVGYNLIYAYPFVVVVAQYIAVRRHPDVYQANIWWYMVLVSLLSAISHIVGFQMWSQYISKDVSYLFMLPFIQLTIQPICEPWIGQVFYSYRPCSWLKGNVIALIIHISLLTVHILFKKSMGTNYILSGDNDFWLLLALFITNGLITGYFLIQNTDLKNVVTIHEE